MIEVKIPKVSKSRPFATQECNEHFSRNLTLAAKLYIFCAHSTQSSMRYS